MTDKQISMIVFLVGHLCARAESLEQMLIESKTVDADALKQLRQKSDSRIQRMLEASRLEHADERQLAGVLAALRSQ